MSKDSVRLNLVMQEKDYEELREYAKEVDRSISSVVRLAIKKYINKDK